MTEYATPPRRGTIEPYSRTGEVRQDSAVLASVEILLRRWRLVVAVPVILGTAVLVHAMVKPGDWVSTSKFSPQSQRLQAPSALMGIAAQLGTSLGGLGSAESIDFYAALVRSREILEQVALTDYADSATATTAHRTLLDIYEIKGDSPRERLNRAVRRLDDDIDVGTDPRSNLVTVSVKAPSPKLAEQIHARLIALVVEFNMRRRQTSARSEREFVENRLAVAARELDDAESELRRFDEANRRVDVPALTLARARLMRRVDQRSSVYTTLSNAHEQARIEEVRNTPVITIIEHPEGSAEKKRGLLLALFGSVVFGFGVGAVAALLRELLARSGESLRERAPRLAGLLERVHLLRAS